MIGSTSRQRNRETANFFDDEFLANPYPRLARLREEGPVVPLDKLFGRQLWLVTRYDEAVAVLEDQRFSVNWRQLFSSPIAWIVGRASGMRRFDLSDSIIAVDEPDGRRPSRAET